MVDDPVLFISGHWNPNNGYHGAYLNGNNG
jgi:hypothetical protein